MIHKFRFSTTVFLFYIAEIHGRWSESSEMIFSFFEIRFARKAQRWVIDVKRRAETQIIFPEGRENAVNILAKSEDLLAFNKAAHYDRVQNVTRNKLLFIESTSVDVIHESRKRSWTHNWVNKIIYNLFSRSLLASAPKPKRNENKNEWRSLALAVCDAVN